MLEVHRSCLVACQPGATLRQLHHLSVRLLADALAQLGVLPGRSAADIMQGAYRRFYPHSGGCPLGFPLAVATAVASCCQDCHAVNSAGACSSRARPPARLPLLQWGTGWGWTRTTAAA